MRQITTKRKISKTTSSLSGRYTSYKCDEPQDYESSLERDFLILTDFDPNVIKFETQPFTIEYEFENKLRKYTPDVYIKLARSKSQIIEIKYSDDIKKNGEKYKPKFDAAKYYADNNNLEFKIITEKEIRSTYLENVKFLLPFRNIEDNYNDEQLSIVEAIFYLLDTYNDLTPSKLFNLMSEEKSEQLKVVPILWNLICKRYVLFNFDEKLNLNSKIWINNGGITYEDD